jgi:hypothetical protein
MPKFSLRIAIIEAEPERLRRKFHYAESSPSGLTLHSGKAVGSRGEDGYWRVMTDERIKLSAHRVVWILHHGSIPTGIQIDHKDGNRSNNRIENLQLLTHAQNRRAVNCRQSNNSTGATGLYWEPQRNKWRATIMRNKRSRILGRFTQKEDAIRAYNAAALQWASENNEEARYLNPV